MSIEITKAEALAIGQKWIDVWNNHSVEKYLEQYTEDIVVISSMALRFFPDSHGKLSDKKLLLEYWTLIRQKFPDLKFVVDKIDFMKNKVIVFYHSENNKLPSAIAILTLNHDCLIERLEVSYS